MKYVEIASHVVWEGRKEEKQFEDHHPPSGNAGRKSNRLSPYLQGKGECLLRYGLDQPDTVMRFLENIEHERILFGSNIPFGTMEWELEKVLSLAIGDDKKEWVLSKNLRKLIGLT